jgi:hypothetical protein
MKKLLILGLALALAGCGGAVIEGEGLSIGIAPTPYYSHEGFYYHHPHWGGGGWHHYHHHRGW